MKQPIPHRSLANRPLRQHPFHRSKPRSKPPYKSLQRRILRLRSQVRVNTDRPQSRPLLHRPPKLLRNPNHPALPVRPPRKPIRNRANPLIPQRPERRPIRPMPRRNPDRRTQPLRPQPRQSRRNPLPLHYPRHPRKLRPLMQRDQPTPPRLASVPVAMQPNRRPSRLHRPHLLPEPGKRRIPDQFRIAILRHHRQNRLDPKSRHKLRKPHPPRPIHRRAQIVKPQQILRRHATTLSGSAIPGGGSSL